MRRCICLISLLLSGCQLSGSGPPGESSLATDANELQVLRQDLPPAPKSIETEADLRNWFSFFYLRKDVNLVPDAINFMSRNDYLSHHPDIASVFLSGVFQQYPDKLNGWLQQFETLPPSTWNVILISLWYSKTEKGKALFRVYFDRSEAGKREDLNTIAKTAGDFHLLDMVATQPRQINLFWAAFSSSGDSRYIEKIISYISYYETEPTTMTALVGETALMSLATNVSMHNRVANICVREEQQNPNPKIRLLLNAMLIAVNRVMTGSEPLAH